MMEMEEIPEFLRRKKGEQPTVVAPKQVPVIPTPVIEATEATAVEEGPTHFEKIQRRMRENAGELIAEINGHYDDFILTGTEFNAYEFFRAREVKAAIAQLIIERYHPELGELLESYKDPELKAAYKNINVKESIKFLESIMADADRWIENLKAVKGKPRRVIPVKQVKGLKFQKEDRELKLISIAPERIIGAQELWTYNTKYKHLAHYVARGRAGLSVKGTTLQDFDVDNSVSKVLRKPEEVLAKVLENKKKILEGLTTKVIVPTGRINENTILLRAK